MSLNELLTIHPAEACMFPLPFDWTYFKCTSTELVFLFQGYVCSASVLFRATVRKTKKKPLRIRSSSLFVAHKFVIAAGNRFVADRRLLHRCLGKQTMSATLPGQPFSLFFHFWFLFFDFPKIATRPCSCCYRRHTNCRSFCDRTQARQSWHRNWTEHIVL